MKKLLKYESHFTDLAGAGSSDLGALGFRDCSLKIGDSACSEQCSGRLFPPLRGRAGLFLGRAEREAPLLASRKLIAADAEEVRLFERSLKVPWLHSWLQS